MNLPPPSPSPTVTSAPMAPQSPFDSPSLLAAFLDAPIAFAARQIHGVLVHCEPATPPLHPAICIVCISDTHSLRCAIPDGDLLIHAGDLTRAGSIQELQQEIDWLNSLPHRHKVAIAGNHDTYLDPRSRQTLPPEQRRGQLDWGNVHYLQHQTVELVFPEQANRTLKIYGAPQIPACGDASFAFQYSAEEDPWSGIVPLGTDVLVTHTPPKWHLDLPVGLGCEHLLKETWRVKPNLHVFGHVHAGSGTDVAFWNNSQAIFERLCARRTGFVQNLSNIWNWWDLALLIASDLGSLCSSISWGGRRRGGILVNAALMSQVTSRLDNAPRTVLV